MISIAKPLIGQEEQAAVAEVLASGMLAAGPRVREFEAEFARLHHSPGAAACTNGTAALCLAVKALGLPAGSKILTTPFSFIATANCILYDNHIPVFGDVDPNTFMLSADTVARMLDADPSIKAVIPVHLYGQAAEIHRIVEVAKARGVYVIEDCAQAHLATENGVPVGAIGDLGIFSFYPTKNMMTGEGGMLTGKNTELLDRCRLLIDHGAPQRYHHVELGWNYRMTSIAAAIGLVQLSKLPAWTARRQYNGKALTEGLQGLPWLQAPVVLPNSTHVYHQYVIKVRDRARLMAHLEAAGVGTAVHYPCIIPEQPFYKTMGYSGDTLPVAMRLSQEVLSLPVHPSVSDDDLQTIIAAVRSFVPSDEAMALA